MNAYENTIIIGLLFERICDDPACPLLPAYSLPPKERVAWAMSLSDHERTRILDHYHEWIRRLDINLLNVAAIESGQTVLLNS